jgi:hypothetical protein
MTYTVAGWARTARNYIIAGQEHKYCDCINYTGISCQSLRGNTKQIAHRNKGAFQNAVVVQTRRERRNCDLFPRLHPIDAPPHRFPPHSHLVNEELVIASSLKVEVCGKREPTGTVVAVGRNVPGSIGMVRRAGENREVSGK